MLTIVDIMFWKEFRCHVNKIQICKYFIFKEMLEHASNTRTNSIYVYFCTILDETKRITMWIFNFYSFHDNPIQCNCAMRDNEKYRSMVSAFRMSELQSLMVFAGKSKAGKKSDLQVMNDDCYNWSLSWIMNNQPLTQ